MSLLGVDVGSSSVKISAYGDDGVCLCGVSHEITPLHPGPGMWEQDPLEIWQATALGLRELAARRELRADPPRALAVSSSGRENFPADRDGNPLANNVMGADIRGAEFELVPSGVNPPEEWELHCGHLRERMDPVFRLLWWRRYRPEILERAVMYLDWHAYLVFRLCGRNVSEPTLVARWLTYDLYENGWSAAKLTQYGVPAGFLPEVLPGGAPIEAISPRVADELGLPRKLLIVTGGHDLNCAGLGAGVNRLGMACLISGSYENMLIPTLQYPTASLLQKGMSITPHFGSMARSVYAVSSTGNAVMNWARSTVQVPIGDAERSLAERRAPSPVMALPYLSGAMLHWQGGRELRGALLGLTLATAPPDIVQAFMESIAYDHANTISLLRAENIPLEQIRATGGGARSAWWTQLKADMMGIPVETAGVEEPGTYGAAILAGLGAGVYGGLEDPPFPSGGRIYTPDAERRDLHLERKDMYCKIIPDLLAWQKNNRQGGM